MFLPREGPPQPFVGLLCHPFWDSYLRANYTPATDKDFELSSTTVNGVVGQMKTQIISPQ